ncbi:hypothetical protein [Erwinia phage Snitter]|nr:hypothetical protein [Erwinia phage Snitter]
MSYRKIINRMVKAQKKHGAIMTEIGDKHLGPERFKNATFAEYNEACRLYNIQVKIWNQLARYIKCLKG